MPLYVLALTDAAAGVGTSAGRRLETLDYGGIHVVCERRAAAPPLTDDELRAQHALVVEIAAQARAVLPARFGSLISRRELTALVRRHEPEIRAALDEVRDRVQMTVRVLAPSAKRTPVAKPQAASGRDYLERARRASALPAGAQRLLTAVQPYVVAERRAPGAGQLLATIYHLVETSQATRYTKAAGRRRPGVIVTGPWPPFAFSPQLW